MSNVVDPRDESGPYAKYVIDCRSLLTNRFGRAAHFGKSPDLVEADENFKREKCFVSFNLKKASFGSCF